MAGVNKAIIIGHLGRDPELRYTQNNTACCNLNVATSRKYMRGQEQVEETEWHRVVVWGKTGEACNQYLAKGRQVYVEGRLQTTSYEKEGVKRYSTQIVAETVQFLGGRDGGGNGSGQGGGAPRGGGSGPKPGDGQHYDPNTAAIDDSIPF